MLPNVLDLARRTLAADAYACWQYTEESGTWEIAAHAGLSEDYVASVPAAIRDNTSVISLEQPIIAQDIVNHFEERLQAMKFELAGVTYDSYMKKLQERQGVVEERILGRSSSLHGDGDERGLTACEHRRRRHRHRAAL